MKLSDQKRLQILDAAEQLFFEQGADNTSMDQLSNYANVSKRTVYNHFATKEALFHAILSRMLDGLHQEGAVQFKVDQAISEQLSAIAQNEVKLLTSEKFLRIAKIAFMQMLKDPSLAQELSTNKIGCLGFLEQFLTEACKAKVLNIDDITFASKQFVYALKSFVFYPKLYGFEVLDPAQELQVINQTVTMFLARYRA